MDTGYPEGVACRGVDDMSVGRERSASSELHNYSEAKSKNRKRPRCTVCGVVEALVLTAIMLGLRGLYTIPTVYFVLPPLIFQPVSVAVYK